MNKLLQSIYKFLGHFFDMLGLFRAGIRISEERIEYFEAWRTFSGMRVTRFMEDSDFDIRNLDFALSRLFQKKGGLVPATVNAALETKGVITRIVTIPHVPESRIRDSLIWELKKYIPLDPESVIVDHQVIEAAFEEGRRVWKVLLVAAKKKQVYSLLDQLERFGLHIESIRYLPVAFVNQYAGNNHESSVAYVDWEQDHVTVNILQKDKLLLNNTSYQRGKKTVYRHIISVLKKFIEDRVSFLEKVVLTVQDENLATEIMEQLNIMVSIQDDADLVMPLEGVPLDSAQKKLVFSLLLKKPLNINLLDQKRAKKLRQWRLIVGGSTLLALFMVVLGWFYVGMQTSSVELSQDQIRLIELHEEFEQESQRLDERIKMYRGLSRLGSHYNRVLVGLTRIVNERNLKGRLWFIRLDINKKSEGLLEGIALSNRDVTRFIGELEQFSFLKEASIKYTKPMKINERACVRYRILFRL